MDLLKNKSLNSEIQSVATVERSEMKEEVVKKSMASHRLAEIGEMMNIQPKALQYLGSAAVHIYAAPNIGEIYFVNQTPASDKVNEVLASAAMTDLSGTWMEKYGRKRPVKRSGF